MTAVTDEPLYEVVNGERVDVPHVVVRPNVFASYLRDELNAFAELHNLGTAATDVAIRIDGRETQRRPAVAFVDAGSRSPRLVVEFIGPTTTAYEWLDMRSDYFASGIQAVWYVYPTLRRIETDSALDTYRPLTNGDTLDDGDVLPGFSLPLTALFDRTPRTQ